MIEQKIDFETYFIDKFCEKWLENIQTVTAPISHDTNQPWEIVGVKKNYLRIYESEGKSEYFDDWKIVGERRTSHNGRLIAFQVKIPRNHRSDLLFPYMTLLMGGRNEIYS